LLTIVATAAVLSPFGIGPTVSETFAGRQRRQPFPIPRALTSGGT
jgi:hypothetical protein